MRGSVCLKAKGSAPSARLLRVPGRAGVAVAAASASGLFDTSSMALLAAKFFVMVC